MLNSIEADQQSWWREIAPDIAFPLAFAGSQLYSTSPLEISEECRWIHSKFDHQHSGIKFVTPQQAHSGEHIELLNRRRELYEGARKSKPGRWISGKCRDWDPVSEVPIIPTNSSVGDESKGGQREVA
ncbi:hypothetical protein [Acidithrix sp. C25]|uniref:hypothetical protein n=1 Tax=Acidithrix sp. C25 TaxID=1671482 RepID=UPI00191BA28E|nr:hypothetical protein [Acidithrix sp. C25]